MRITGKYDGWETETYVMQLSPKDVNCLQLLLKRLSPEPQHWDIEKMRFLDMLSEADEEDFGFEKHVTKEY